MKKIVYKYLSKWFLSDCSNYNKASIRSLCYSKQQARRAFKKLDVPYAKGEVFYLPHHTFSFAKKYGFPLVVKPNVGGFSRGAHFPINNYWQLLKASILVKVWWHSSIVERYLAGNNYRIVALKDQVMAIAKRYSPFVIGNGVDSISVLIDKENNVRKQMNLLPIIATIPKNKAIISHLKQQGLSLSSVLNLERKVILHPKIAIKLGGVVEAVPASHISENNIETVLKIVRYFDANILGIDVICKRDLMVDFAKQDCVFLEVNSRPFLKMHDVCRFGKAPDLSEFYRQLELVNQ